jgi:hypothetical protein
MAEPTKLRLARMLRDNGFPVLAERAEEGEFSDFESDHALPKIELVGLLADIYKHSPDPKRCQRAYDLAQMVMEGEFDETKEEGEEWFQREGKNLMDKL